MKRKFSISEAKEYMSMTEEEQDQYDAYCEEQERLSMIREYEFFKGRIQEAIELLEENGYKVIKDET